MTQEDCVWLHPSKHTTHIRQHGKGACLLHLTSMSSNWVCSWLMVERDDLLRPMEDGASPAAAACARRPFAADVIIGWLVRRTDSVALLEVFCRLESLTERFVCPPLPALPFEIISPTSRSGEGLKFMSVVRSATSDSKSGRSSGSDCRGEVIEAGHKRRDESIEQE